MRSWQPARPVHASAPFGRARPTRRRFLRYAFGAGAGLLAVGGGLARAEPVEHLWVATRRPTPLELDPSGAELRWLPTGILLRASAAPDGPRLRVWCPAFGAFGTVAVEAVESVPAPSEAEVAAQRKVPVLPAVTAALELPGRVVGGANLRYWPNQRPDSRLLTLPHNAALWVVELVDGEDGGAWYRVDEQAAGARAVKGASYFVHSDLVRLPRTDYHPTPANPDRVWPQWLEADLQEPTLLTAYQDRRPVWSSLALYGRERDATPLGRMRVLARVQRETMSSERVVPPIPRNAPGGYHLENVLYTQYFHPTGAAIHYNYWSSNWGYRGSHGCLGLPLAEAKWAWDFARIGTPVTVFS
jgi:hypothetical protein